VEHALNNAAIDTIHRARRFGSKYVIWEEGHVKELGPEETAPHEKRLCENVERLSRKIAELQAQNPNALSLNEELGQQKVPPHV
jgi:hypothetical protein